MIRAARLVEFRRPLSEARASAAGRWSERTGALLVLEGADGQQGLGEASPLPGYSPDDLRAVWQALSVLVPAAPQLAGDAPPAARAALEAALLDLRARRAGEPAWKHFVEHPPRALALTRWLPSEPMRALELAREGRARGVHSFKVKLEPGSEIGLELLRALRREHGDGIALTADANGSLGSAELAVLLPALREISLAWLEEPSQEPFEAAPGVPLALDESLRDGAHDFARARSIGVVTLVLKPTSLGGIEPALGLARAAAAHGIAAVASHTLEGPVGYMAAATLALALGSAHPHGLGPHPGLGGVRIPALAEERDELVPWSEPGFGLDEAAALFGAECVREVRL